MKNHDKALLLQLLELERFRIMQHSIKVKNIFGTDLSNWANRQANQFNY